MKSSLNEVEETFIMAFEDLFHIKHQLGAVQVVAGAETRTQFRLFFAANSDTQIESIRVAGTFQSKIGEVDWDYTKNHFLTKSSAKDSPEEGKFWTLKLNYDLPVGFYEYKYQVTFKGPGKVVREVADPCARYSGQKNLYSGFVVGEVSLPRMS
jgi:pullulanase